MTATNRNLLETSKTNLPPFEIEQIYNEQLDLVRGVLFRIIGAQDIDDATQEVFVKIWRRLDRFEKNSNFKTWVYRIAVNVGLDFLRKRKRRLELNSFDELKTASQSGTFKDQELLLKALDLISEDHRVVIVLHYFEELSLLEISESLELPIGTVKSRLFHSRKVLRDCLRQLGKTSL